MGATGLDWLNGALLAKVEDEFSVDAEGGNRQIILGWAFDLTFDDAKVLADVLEVGINDLVLANRLLLMFVDGVIQEANVNVVDLLAILADVNEFDGVFAASA